MIDGVESTAGVAVPNGVASGAETRPFSNRNIIVFVAKGKLGNTGLQVPQFYLQPEDGPEDKLLNELFLIAVISIFPPTSKVLKS